MGADAAALWVSLKCSVSWLRARPRVGLKDGIECEGVAECRLRAGSSWSA